jgi:hypothetical protein
MNTWVETLIDEAICPECGGELQADEESIFCIRGDFRKELSADDTSD